MLSHSNTSAAVASKNPRTAVWALATTEQHGDHLPVGTDLILMEEIARRTAKALGEESYLLPVWPLGTSISHAGSPGTIHVQYSTLHMIINDVIESLYAQGIEQVAVINNHGQAGGAAAIPQGNYIAKTAVRQLNYSHPACSAIWVQPFTAASEQLAAIFDALDGEIHAGAIETSLLLHLRPELVDEERARNSVPGLSEDYLQYAPFRNLSPTGVWGRPEGATRSLGKRALKAVVECTVDYIEETFAQLNTYKGGQE